MNLTKNYMTKNRCYTKAVSSYPKKLILHSLGCAQPKADVLIKQWNTPDASVCVHGFIETDRVIQTLPWDYKGWHVGKGSKGSYNSNSIGIEICEPKGHTYKGGTMIGYDIKKNTDYFAKVYKNAVELFAYLCRQFNLDPLKDILCHSEVHALGYGSNHSDVMHWFPKHGKSMDTFRADVLAAMIVVIPERVTPDSGTDEIRWLQHSLNQVLPEWFPKIAETGIYDAVTRIAVLVYWEQLGWGKHMDDDGRVAGKSTCRALADNRKV